MGSNPIPGVKLHKLRLNPCKARIFVEGCLVHQSLFRDIRYAIVPRRNRIRPEIVKYRISGIIVSKGRFFVIVFCMALTSFVKGSASPKI